MQEPPAERSAEQLLKSAEVHFQDGRLEEALEEYTEAESAARLNLYKLQTRKQFLLGTGTGAAFRKTPEGHDRSIHTAREGTLWRAVESVTTTNKQGLEEEWIGLLNGLWLPRASLVLMASPLDQQTIRALAAAGATTTSYPSCSRSCSTPLADTEQTCGRTAGVGAWPGRSGRGGDCVRGILAPTAAQLWGPEAGGTGTRGL